MNKLDFKRWQKLTELKQKHDSMVALNNIENSEQEFKSGEAKILTSLADLLVPCGYTLMNTSENQAHNN